MRLTKEALPYDTIYREFAKLVDNDIVDYDILQTGLTHEGFNHYKLKLIAQKILEERGFTVDAPREELMGRFDVIAQKGEIRINVEVGITPLVRIWDNLCDFDEIWHIPYDQGNPCVIYIFKRGKHYWHYQDFITGTTDLMVKCPKCSKPNFLQSNCCGYCGHNLESSLVLCRTCGQPLPKELKIIGNIYIE
jgi:hypothetical protein